MSAAYFQRFGFCDRQIAAAPHAELGLAVVIPCHNEPDLVSSLESLWACARPDCAVEVIVVINSAQGSGAEILGQNRATWERASAWVAAHADARMAFHLLRFPELPPKQAGVGLARKIGMDEALRRFHDLGCVKLGVIACFDADCLCDRKYLVTLERHFRSQPRTPGCSIYFEHPLCGPLDAAVYDGAAAYELHLRYYVQALRYAGFPHAHHTLGSCMAVRAGVYEAQGGMNRRQAGEDFYFLHKVIPLGGFTDLIETTVYPSPRPSDRVPFGTGKAVRDSLDGRPQRTYPLRAFADLGAFLAKVDLFQVGPDAATLSKSFPDSVRTYLEKVGFEEKLTEIGRNTSTPATFRHRFYRWFTGFQAMKFVHHARDRFYGDADLLMETQQLLTFWGGAARQTEKPSVRSLLNTYRRLDRQPGTPPPPAPQ